MLHIIGDKNFIVLCEGQRPLKYLETALKALYKSL